MLTPKKPLSSMGSYSALDTAWEVLDTYGLELQGCDQTEEQIRLTLIAVQQGLAADAVCWYSASTHETLDIVGEPRPSSAWCRELAERVLGETPGVDNQLLRSFVGGLAEMTPAPHSVAMVRLSKSRGVWVAALSFHPQRFFCSTDIRIMTLVRRMLLGHRQHCRVYEKLRETLFDLVRCLTATIDVKDPYIWGHSERVARIAVRLGRQLHFSSNGLSDLYLAGLLHDIGKIGIRDEVLQKPARLTAEEMLHVQEHTLIGDRLLSTIQQLAHLRPGIRNHHERYDGQGYPDGLAGEQIPLLARVLAVADACDAMMSARPYRPALPPEHIDAIMLEGAGRQWDPDIIQQFLDCRQELYPICQRGTGDSVFRAVERALHAADDDLFRGSQLHERRTAEISLPPSLS
jgi:HD-GYP domain-containing protein (c-di-GMP phosphodiesterase class II)